MSSVLRRFVSALLPYRPPLWARHPYAQLVVRQAQLSLCSPVRLQTRVHRFAYRRDRAPSCLHYCFPPGASRSAPTLLFLPGVTGNELSVQDMMRATTRRGWRAVVHLRRGHDPKHPTPRFNIMGCTSDMRDAVEETRQLLRQAGCEGTSPVCVVGVSAGSGLAIRFLGEEGVAALGKVAACVCLFPGYDISTAFGRCEPWCAWFITRRIKRFFLRRNRSQLVERHGEKAYQRAMNSPDLETLVVRCAQFSQPDEKEWDHPTARRLSVAAPACTHMLHRGDHDTPTERAHLHAFLSRSNPFPVVSNVRVPTLVVNTEDDPIAVRSNIPRERFRRGWMSHEDSVLVITQLGSHACHLQGVFAEANPYFVDLMFSYIEQVVL